MRLAHGAALALALFCAACSSSKPDPAKQASLPAGAYKLGKPYQINGRWYRPEFDEAYDVTGTASWYGDDFHGKPTANGEVFDKNQITAAHPTLPLPSRVRVTNLDNGKVLELRVNDRGPFIGDRLIDLSEAAARELGYDRRGLANVRVQFLELAEARGRLDRIRRQSRRQQRHGNSGALENEHSEVAGRPDPLLSTRCATGRRRVAAGRRQRSVPMWPGPWPWQISC